jgi:hypothetical protein
MKNGAEAPFDVSRFPVSRFPAYCGVFGWFSGLDAPGM